MLGSGAVLSQAHFLTSPAVCMSGPASKSTRPIQALPSHLLVRFNRTVKRSSTLNVRGGRERIESQQDGRSSFGFPAIFGMSCCDFAGNWPGRWKSRKSSRRRHTIRSSVKAHVLAMAQCFVMLCVFFHVHGLTECAPVCSCLLFHMSCKPCVLQRDCNVCPRYKYIYIHTYIYIRIPAPSKGSRKLLHH